MVVTASPSCITASVRQELMRRPFDQHRAGAALAVVAALLGAGQAEVLAQASSSVVRGSSVQRARLAVHVQGEWEGGQGFALQDGVRARQGAARTGAGTPAL